MDTLPSSFPFTSDPALNEDWEGTILPNNTFSDDIEAIQLVEEEEKRRKTKAGVVIQHRSWKTAEIFRSEADFPEGNHLSQINFTTS
jgi:chromosome transmission fidelity protein 18